MYHIACISLIIRVCICVLGVYSCVEAEIHLRRNWHFYLFHTYIPSMLIVILSWANFWIDYQAVAGRVSLGLLTVLTMTTQSSSVNARLPKVSYIKAVDVWLVTCLAYVFGMFPRNVCIFILNYLKYTKNKFRKPRYLTPFGNLTLIKS